jgi:hypothetical protein
MRSRIVEEATRLLPLRSATEAGSVRYGQLWESYPVGDSLNTETGIYTTNLKS